MDIETIEEEIRSRVESKLGSNFSCMVLPENDEEFKRPLTKPLVTVAYWGSEFDTDASKGGGNPMSKMLGGFVSQDEMLIFDIVLQAKRLRGSSGLYAMLRKTKQALLGFRPTDCEKMKVAKLGFVKREEQIFTYQLSMSTVSPLVEDQDAEDEPLVKEITLDSDNGQSVTPIAE